MTVQHISSFSVLNIPKTSAKKAENNHICPKDNISKISEPCSVTAASINQPIAGSLIYYGILNQINEKINNPHFADKNFEHAVNILSDNKEEVQNILNFAYNILQKYYNFRPSKFDYSDWQPVMDLENANEYVKNSSTSKEHCYRGSAHPEQTKLTGYKLDRTGPEYPGIYVSDSKQTASEYGANPLHLKIRANNIVRLDGWNGFEAKLFDFIKSRTDNEEILSVFNDIKGILEHQIGEKLNIDAFDKRVQAFEEDEPTTAYILLNPKNIVIVE